MRLAPGTTSVSTSGGTVVLTGRRGAAWPGSAVQPLSIDAAVALLEADGQDGAHADPAFAESVPSTATDAVRFAPGDEILWRYGRTIETARVIQDDARGLVVWIPTGAPRLQPGPADGRRPREVPLAERFRVPWVIRESAWSGAGLLRVAPHGKPWSVWFFRDSDGRPEGAYVNIELPHRRDAAGIYTRDLVLDLWIDAEHPGSEDIWLKDADELAASHDQGRFTSEQADAVRALADHAARAFAEADAWPLDAGWDRWTPSAAMDTPLVLPDTEAIAAARARTGTSGIDG